MSAAAQLEASDPRVSAFVSAHAGTGKTKLLVDRLLRLMLAGADPARILCLTYTKAAAAEMAIRLQARLGKWVTLNDAALAVELASLEVGPSSLQTARALFARVLDLPGGMRIGTIHAFCQSLLKRFPLEAQISPHFRLLVEADARDALDEARAAIVPLADQASVAVLAGLVNDALFAKLTAELEQARDRLGPALALPAAQLEQAILRVAGVTAADEGALIAAAVVWPEEADLRRVAVLMQRDGTATVREKGDKLLAWLALEPALRAEHFGEWVKEFCLDDHKPRGPGVFAKGKLKGREDILAACLAEQARVCAVLDSLRAMRMASATIALLRVAVPVLRVHAQGKDRRAALDYSDLISRSLGLLDDQEIGAAWVLFKLDSGLDHLLLDEVQDTAPLQWRIADRLTGDFFAGEGARQERAPSRSMFAVGDRKQSIYSFQGADPSEFDRWRRVYGQRVAQAGLPWRAAELATSFRSTAPVLALVDAVFAQEEAGIREAGEAVLCHAVHRHGHAGRVELWPLAPQPESPPHMAWTIPAQNQASITAVQTLVNELADWIARQLSDGVALASEGRALRPGDILVLVRRRGEFARGLVRALKARAVPVAGLDRMVLTDQPAVQDLLSLCEALLLPQDDLSLAEMLVSPLGGLSDSSLMDLAATREGSLWDALRARAGERPDWLAAEAFFATLLGRVDYAHPYALLSEALGPLGGRARLFARLGPEAAEPVDEVLAAAMDYTATHPPSLQGFLHFLSLSGAEVKREAEEAGDSVRVMTVHGSKGLEAPLVILPDTTSLPPAETGLAWARDTETGIEVPLWQPNGHFRCAAVESVRRAQAAKCHQEYYRLLYVALTRARDRVLICGWEVRGTQEGSWYQRVGDALRGLGAARQDFAAWPGESLVIECAQTEKAGDAPRRAAGEAAALPSWAGQAPDWRAAPLPPEPHIPRPLAPSRPDGAGLGSVPPSRSPLLQAGQPDRFSRGLVMHALLQHLPEVPPSDRARAAAAYLRRLNAPDALAAQALAVLDAPALAPLFGPGSRAEQSVCGLIGPHIVSGQVDRLAILPGRVLIADYKTNRAPPDSVDKVPVLYLRQMAAYRAVLARLYPDRDVECVLIWTEAPRVMILPGALLDSYAPGAAPSPAHA